MARSFLLLLLILAAPAVALAEDADQVDAAPAVATNETAASVTATGPTEPIHPGETVDVTFQVTHPAGATITFPPQFKPERWVLLNTQRVPTTDAERATSSTWVLTFGVYRPGSTTLAPFDVTVTTAAGSTTVQTQPVDLKVVSIYADAAAGQDPDFAAPRPPVEVWVDDYTLAYVGGGGVLLALLGIAAWAVRRRQLLAPVPPPPPRDPHEVALEKLSALAGGDLLEAGEHMAYWVRMSEAIREYLGRSYGFGGTEMTTTEMLVALEHVKWPSGIGLSDVHDFLRRCDEVKFGGVVPTHDESTAVLRRAFTVVELTKPRPVLPALTEVTRSDDEVGDEEDAATSDEDTVVDQDARWRPHDDSGAS